MTVRLLFDHLGSRGIPGYKEFVDAARRHRHRLAPDAAGRARSRAQFQRPDLRNHRKLLVVDGRIGFMGSQNLIEPGYNKPKNHAAGREWVELIARIDGPDGQRARRGVRHRTGTPRPTSASASEIVRRTR